MKKYYVFKVSGKRVICLVNAIVARAYFWWLAENHIESDVKFVEI